MTAMRATWPWYGVFVAAALVANGCNQIGALAYVLNGPPVIPPELHKLAADDKKKEVKVMILTYSPNMETRPELVGADRQLSMLFARKLQAACKENQENVTVISPQKIEQYKQQHPDWHESIDLEEIGRHFKADYVIYLEMNQLGIYQDKTVGNQLYQGTIKASVSLIDVTKRSELDNDHAEFSFQYPDENNAIDIDSMTPDAFRFKFYTFAAERLSWYFTGHTKEDEYDRK